MAKRLEGNGESKFKVVYHEQPSYVLVAPHEPGPNYPENVSFIINQAMADWLKEHPTLRVRTVLHLAWVAVLHPATLSQRQNHFDDGLPLKQGPLGARQQPSPKIMWTSE